MLQFMGSQRVRHNWVTELNCRYSRFNILRNCFPKHLDHYFTFSLAMHHGFNFFISLQTHYRVFISVIPTGMQRHLIMVLVCLSPRINDIEHLFMCHVYILFWRNIKSFGHFKSQLFVFCKSSSYILDINSNLYGYMICKYFLLFCGSSFHFLYGVLWSTDVLNFK